MALFLLVTHGSDGDVLPFVSLGAALVRAGHRAVLLTHAPYREAAARAGLGFEPIDGEDAFERVLADTPHLLGGTRARLGWDAFYRRNGMFEQIAAECRTLRRLHSPGETVLVGRHTSAVSVRFTAELLGAPAAWVALAPTQLMAAPVAAHLYGTELADGLQAVRAGLGQPPIRDWRAWFAASDAEIGLWPSWFDAAGTRSPARTSLTGFPLPDGTADALGARQAGPTDAPGTLRGGPADGPADVFGGAFAPGVRPVLATGGTGRMLDPDYYPALVAAAAETGLPTLLVVRHRDLLPASLPGNLRWSPGLSFAAAVPRAAAVVHHGGIGTTARVLASGTPQVLMADGIDRPDNAARLARWGLARTVPAARWRTADLPAAVRAAASDHGYRARARAVAGLPDPHGAQDAAADRLVRLLDRTETAAPDGSVRDRLRDLPPRDLERIRARLRLRLDRPATAAPADLPATATPVTGPAPADRPATAIPQQATARTARRAGDAPDGLLLGVER
ncbi:glycosyltransferase [Kitasatospora sp. NBC_01539]|uniref:glycosyltransferase n=1 Tax=Kitasatospora sp. NBC_01539 TaxID=2903577 RepID=UPI0038600B36